MIDMDNQVGPGGQVSPGRSSSPESEATLNDESMISENVPVQLVNSTVSQQTQAVHNLITESTVENMVQTQHSISQFSGPINTDYESSAPEDYESFTSSKYEVAEFALLSYCRTNKLDKLRVLLDAKLKGELSLDLNFKGSQKQNFSWSCLHLACYFGHLKVVELLFSKKQFRDEIDKNIQNNSGDTPLHKAILTNRVEIVQLLLSNGAHVYTKNCDGLLPKQLTENRHILDMIAAAEQVDKLRSKQLMFKAVDNGDLKKLQEYFNDYRSYMELSEEASNQVNYVNSVGANKDLNDDQIMDFQVKISNMVDERGNSLLHIAAMRGFQAICVYLLEQGFDPFRKNELGLTCIDLSSYQLRKLFMSVKPAKSRLRHISNQRVTRFEGPLMKKVRILGWKASYVVLENGVILLFNNRRDSINRSRRGYKYLESSTCEPDNNDVGVFHITFSDRSRVTFLVSTGQLTNYPTPKFSVENRSAENQVDLVRQLWIDSVRDHIRYSTEFIRKGLNLNEDEEKDCHHDNDLTNFDHLLPIDTIKSFVHEARAHFSILERHSDSLCSLIHSLNIPIRSPLETIAKESGASFDASMNGETSTVNDPTGNRIVGFFRSRQGSKASLSSRGSGATGSLVNPQRRFDGNTLELVQENWNYVLFHLRLLMESAQNTKSSMSQALALMENQEQLRQNRIQDQDEKCRVLEASLQALAIDHHELEKSLSMSQIYHSAVGGRSISLSTDINEYFDAFEDFDDEKTVTPNSMSSEEEVEQRMLSLLESERDPMPTRDQQPRLNSCYEANDCDGNGLLPERHDDQVSFDDDEIVEDDLRSNCSALTIATVSDASALMNPDMSTVNHLNDRSSISGIHINRTRLPSPMIPRDQVSIWSILKNCIGKELSKITMPVVFNEPLTMLQRACEGVQYTHLLITADASDNPIDRMEFVCAFIIAGLSANCHRIIKPFNPLLYETYEYTHHLNDGTEVNTIAQQVSHHPPITAIHVDSDNFSYTGSMNPKIKFWGRSVEVQPDGQCRVHLKRHNETYVFKSVSCSVNNIIVGKLWFEHHGPLDVTCSETGLQANLIFKQAGWFSNELHRFNGFIVRANDKTGQKQRLRFVYGKWSDYLKSVGYEHYESYLRENSQKVFKIPDRPDDQTNGLVDKLTGLNLAKSNSLSNNNNSIRNESSETGTGCPLSKSTGNEGEPASKSGDQNNSNPSKSNLMQSIDIPNSRTLWRLESRYLEEYYNFSLFTMRLNDMNPELEKSLPRSDSRFRPDVRKLEEGDLDGAANEKHRLEEKQREARSRDRRFKDPSPEFLWFDLTTVPQSKEKFWVYKGGYWDSRSNSERFPDLF